MFKKQGPNMNNLTAEKEKESSPAQNYQKNIYEKSSQVREKVEPGQKKKVNAIVKGSRLAGDINITYDLELDGEVEGNITSIEDSNIVIKGNCRGSINTRGGNVNIEGEMSNGDIFAGGDVKISGKFNGGKVEAKGKIYVGGEFSGKLVSNEIEIGQEARGKGEIFYKEFISIAKGAKVEANITLLSADQKEIKKVIKKAEDRKETDQKRELHPDPVEQLILSSTR